jgi:hypothetical protein
MIYSHGETNLSGFFQILGISPIYKTRTLRSLEINIGDTSIFSYFFPINIALIATYVYAVSCTRHIALTLMVKLRLWYEAHYLFC